MKDTDLSVLSVDLNKDTLTNKVSKYCPINSDFQTAGNTQPNITPVPHSDIIKLAENNIHNLVQNIQISEKTQDTQEVQDCQNLLSLEKEKKDVSQSQVKNKSYRECLGMLSYSIQEIIYIKNALTVLKNTPKEKMTIETEDSEVKKEIVRLDHKIRSVTRLMNGVKHNFNNFTNEQNIKIEAFHNTCDLHRKVARELFRHFSGIKQLSKREIHTLYNFPENHTFPESVSKTKYMHRQSMELSTYECDIIEKLLSCTNEIQILEHIKKEKANNFEQNDQTTNNQTESQTNHEAYYLELNTYTNLLSSCILILKQELKIIDFFNSEIKGTNDNVKMKVFNTQITNMSKSFGHMSKIENLTHLLEEIQITNIKLLYNYLTNRIQELKSFSVNFQGYVFMAKNTMNKVDIKYKNNKKENHEFTF